MLIHMQNDRLRLLGSQDSFGQYGTHHSCHRFHVQIWLGGRKEAGENDRVAFWLSSSEEDVDLDGLSGLFDVCEEIDPDDTI
jgi:hypothetical protein